MGVQSRSKSASSIFDGASVATSVSVNPLFRSLSGSTKSSLGVEADFAKVAQGDALDDTPLESETFRRHTALGFVFKPLGLERIFLNGTARHSFNVVILGYVLMLLMSLFDLVRIRLSDVYRESCTNQYICNEVAHIYSFGDYEYYFKYVLPIYVSFTVIGCSLHVLIFKLKCIRDKYWAMVSTFVLYFVFGVVLYTVAITTQNSEWPGTFLRTSLEMITIYVFFSGTPSFLCFVAIWLMTLISYGLGYFYSLKTIKRDHGADSWSELALRTSFIQCGYPLLLYFVVILAGVWMQERARRKQFLQKIIMMYHQQEIIRHKTRNSTLQRTLLEHVLPSSMVNKLQQQNFAVTSWKELRSLSQRHLGVCIMFAELDGFTDFSAQVSPRCVLKFLNSLFDVFDQLCGEFDVYKVETVGDQYVAALGVVTGQMLTEEVGTSAHVTFFDEASEDDHDDASEREGDSYSNTLQRVSKSNTTQMLAFARAIMKAARYVDRPKVDINPQMRVGIHTGSCMSGIVGTKNFRFCLFGDAMNTAARMVQNGSADCIHATKDVADLVPDQPWERLKEIKVKGKGSMQTFSLCVAKENLSDSFYDSSRKSLVETFSFLGGDSHADRTQTLGLLSDQLARLPEESVYENLWLVKEKVYKEKTTFFGLLFKNCERSYLDGEARLIYWDVYIGYIIYVIVLLSNMLYGFVNYRLHHDLCTSVDHRKVTLCIQKFGEAAFEMAQDPRTTYNEIISYSLFNLTTVPLCILLGLNALGPLTHWLLHRSRKIKRKSWAILNAWVIYFLKLMVLLVIMYLCNSTTEVQRPEWPWGYAPVIVTQALLLNYFTGVPMKLYLLWWVIGIAIYFGTTYPILLDEMKGEENDFNIAVSIFSYIRTSMEIISFALILNLGKYYKDVNNRRRFLQRVLTVKQQDQIIKEKSKTERIQKQFLGNIMPPHLLEELKEDKLNGNLISSLTGLRSFTQTHLGVSMLYADIVGFTAFSAQVDPFQVMVFLNDLFQVFDGMCDEYNVYKIETVGDCYVAAVGVVTGKLVTGKAPTRSETSRNIYGSMSGTIADTGSTEGAGDMTWSSYDSIRCISSTNATDLVGFAKAMIRGSRRVMKPTLKTPATMRIGIHTGSCMSGVIGAKNLKFSLLGEDVVTAALMEKTGKADAIHASDDLALILPNENWQEFKELDTNKGRIQTFLLDV